MKYEINPPCPAKANLVNPKEEEKMMDADDRCCPYRQQETMKRKEQAFDTLREKLRYYAALAECVEDAVEDASFSLDTPEKVKKSNKLTELVYLLTSELRQLSDYLQTIS